MRNFKLGDLAEVVFLGRVQSRIRTASDAEPVPIVSARDVADRLAPVGSMDTVNALPGRDIDSARLRSGDVVVTARGQLRAAVATARHGGAIAGANLAVLRFASPSLPHVVAAYLRSPGIERILHSATAGTATVALNVGDLRSLPLSIPAESELEALSEAVRLTELYITASLDAIAARRRLLSELARRTLEAQEVDR